MQHLMVNVSTTVPGETVKRVLQPRPKTWIVLFCTHVFFCQWARFVQVIAASEDPLELWPLLLSKVRRK